MARRSQRLRLLDMAAQMAAIDSTVAAHGSAAMKSDWLVRNAIERGMEIISEASRHLDPKLTSAHPDVPWRQVADIGNWLRHAYEQVDPDLILSIITGHFPAMHAATTAMLAITPED